MGSHHQYRKKPNTQKLLVFLVVFCVLIAASYHLEKDKPPFTQNEHSKIPGEDIKEKITNQEKGTTAQVVRVVDGDTVKLNLAGSIETIRLVGIDTPEAVRPDYPIECFGNEASKRAKELLAGQYVHFETDPSQDTRDQYGRLLGYIFLPDGRNFAEVMLEEGYATEFTYAAPYVHQASFTAAQRRAQNTQKGLWNPTNCPNQ